MGDVPLKNEASERIGTITEVRETDGWVEVTAMLDDGTVLLGRHPTFTGIVVDCDMDTKENDAD